MAKKFYLDNRNGKFLGVCSGIAAYTGIDATFVRIAAVVVTVLGAFPWTLIAYGIAAWLARPMPLGGIEEEAVPRARRSTAEIRESMRDIDRRMAEIDSYMTSTDGRLAREIEELR